MAKDHPHAKCTVEEETGEHVVMGNGETMVKACIFDIRRLGGARASDFMFSDMSVSYCETITDKSKQV